MDGLVHALDICVWWVVSALDTSSRRPPLFHDHLDRLWGGCKSEGLLGKDMIKYRMAYGVDWISVVCMATVLCIIICRMLYWV